MHESPIRKVKTPSIGKQKALKDLQDYYKYTRTSSVRQKWLNQYLVNLSYYRGNQWLEPELLKEMSDIGATPYTYNNIEPLVDAYVSLQIRSSKRVGYESSTDNPEHIKLAEYLKHLAYDIQTQNDHVFFSSHKFTSSLIGGVGWSYFSYKNNKFIYEYIDPIEILWDPDDKSLKLDDSNFVCRVHYVSAIKLKNQYPDFAKEFDEMVEENSTNPSDYTTFNSISDSARNGLSSSIVGNPQDDGGWVRGRTIKIVEVFYKKLAKYYETTVLFPEQVDDDSISNEQLFTTFDEAIAKEKSANGKVEVKDGSQIWHGIFCDEMLIENNPIAEQVPNQKQLPITPVVFKRDYQGVPYGVIDNLISIQKTRNYLWSTTLHFLDAKTIMVSDEQQNTDKLREFLKDEMRSKNGVVFVKNPSELQVLDNENKLNYRMSLLEANYKEFESQTGLYDELKGEQTNAISGVAIAQRATNSMNAQNSLVLAYENMIVSEGRIMLDTIKGLKKFRHSFKFFANGKNSQVTMDDSVSLLNFEVYPDISPNFSSSIQEEKARFAELMNSPNPTLLMSSPLFLRELGFRESISYELSEEYTRIMGLTQPQDEQSGEQNAKENEVI